MRRLFNYRTVTIVLFALILSAVAYGFAAANTVPNNSAGEGQAVVSGYVVQNINYALNTTNPANFNTVGFDLYLSDGTTNAPNTTEVHVGIGDGATTYWTTCTAGTLPAWSCNISASTVNVRAATDFHVAAAD